MSPTSAPETSDSPSKLFERGRTVHLLLLGLLLAVPLLPNFGLFTTFDVPKRALLVVGSLILLVLVLLRALRSKEPVKLPLPENLSILSLLVVAALFLGKRAPDAKASLDAWATIGTLCALGIVTAKYLTDTDGSRRVFLAIVAAGAAASLLGIAGSFGILWGTASTFGNPSFAAEYVAAAVPIAIALFLIGRRRTAAAAFVLMIVFLVLAKSRADWLALLAGLGALGLLEVFRRRERRPSPRILTGLLLAGITILPWLPEIVPVPLFGRSDTVEIRRLIRRSTLEMAGDHPVVGVGLDGFRAHYPAYRDPEETRLSLRREVAFPHNLPLSVLSETGAIGLLTLLAFLWVTISAGIRTVWRHPDDGIAFGATGAIVALLVSAQFSAPLRHPGSALLFFALTGLVLGRRPRRFVTELKGRYRRALPVLLLLVPVVVGTALLPARLLADGRMKAARDREVMLNGGMDETVEGMLVRSIDARPTPDALRQLAFYRNGTDRPEEAMSLLDLLFVLSPHDEAGRVERARALLGLEHPVKALAIIEDLLPGREKDEILLRLEATALLHAPKTVPIPKAREYARRLSDRYPEQVLALIRVAERVGAEEPERALAILEEIPSPEAVYYRALILAASGRLDDSMNALRRAIDEGVVDLERMRDDPRLGPLRGRADFRTLLERF